MVARSWYWPGAVVGQEKVIVLSAGEFTESRTAVVPSVFFVNNVTFATPSGSLAITVTLRGKLDAAKDVFGAGEEI